MSEPKWTPGPWLREGLVVYALEHDGWRKGVETFRNRFYLRVQTPHTTPHTEEEAITALVAASPLLYDALTEARLQIEYMHGKLGAETGSGNSVLARIDAVQAKARGEVA